MLACRYLSAVAGVINSKENSIIFFVLNCYNPLIYHPPSHKVVFGLNRNLHHILAGIDISVDSILLR